ncbi:META domain-containing protein [Leucobacter insecticola]|uniref:META domain-containing protein n=1 Tax=Leucobacter insecticola TaxID=2714934 RepID=A0A6G8FGN6_9MICO|nr:META domain-containing protein [Leucobacter insecticola]QIM15515.1 META domain-containing protein [Leucobacter insecticola]
MLKQEIIGTWESAEKGSPFLSFSADGRVSGSDGCNGISTDYVVTNEEIVLQEFASTRKACQGVDDWLRGVRSVTVDGTTLHVVNKAGEEIGQLQLVKDGAP